MCRPHKGAGATCADHTKVLDSLEPFQYVSSVASMPTGLTPSEPVVESRLHPLSCLGVNEGITCNAHYVVKCDQVTGILGYGVCT